MSPFGKFLRLALGALSAVTLATRAVAEDFKSDEFLVLGVIASEDPGAGVALIKDVPSGRTFAARAGQQIGPDVQVRSITRSHVYLRVGQQIEKVIVGEQVRTADIASHTGAYAEGTGVERQGSLVRVTSAMREDVKRQLGKVLMQAAAVPYYVDGELGGFRLWDIDQGSIYERVGFTDGDIVTSINGQALTDIGNTIKMLQSMKDEPKAEVTFIRKGVQQTVQIVVQ